MKKEFNELWALHPSGEKKETYDLYMTIIEEKFINFDDKIIDHKFLIKSLEKYLEFWNHTFGKRDLKYISTKDQKITLQSWLAHKKWDEEYNIETNTKRNKYIFGDYSLKELTELITQFEIKLYGKPKKEYPF